MPNVTYGYDKHGTPKYLANHTKFVFDETGNSLEHILKELMNRQERTEIIFLKNGSFPDVGDEGVLYCDGKDFYCWKEDNRRFLKIESDTTKNLVSDSHTHENKELLDAVTAPFTPQLQEKLAGGYEHSLAEHAPVDAQKNIQADWTATSGDDYIKNKPVLGSASEQDISFFATARQGELADSSIQSVRIGDIELEQSHGSVQLPEYPTRESLNLDQVTNLSKDDLFHNPEFTGEYVLLPGSPPRSDHHAAHKKYVDEQVRDSKQYTNTEIAMAKAYTNTRISDLVGGAGDALDTLEELSKALGEDPDFATTVSSALAQKALKSTTIAGHALESDITAEDLKLSLGIDQVVNEKLEDQIPIYEQADALENLAAGERFGHSLGKLSKAVSDFIFHKADTFVHVTDADRNRWNENGNGSESIIDFVPSPERIPIQSGSRLSLIIGILAKTIEDIKTAAFTGKAADLIQDGEHRFFTDAERNKLSGIANEANYYSHPTASGNKHIPSGGASGKILRWSADGTTAWGDDINTWRGIQNNLTSTSTSDSLSAAQGKILNEKKIDTAKITNNFTTTAEGYVADARALKTIWDKLTTAVNNITSLNTSKAAANHSHAYSAITGKPGSFPPSSHASTGTGYGAGNAGNFGHVKLTDSYTSNAGAAANSVAASSKALYDAYVNLNNRVNALQNRFSNAPTKVWYFGSNDTFYLVEKINGIVFFYITVHRDDVPSVPSYNGNKIGTLPDEYRPLHNVDWQYLVVDNENQNGTFFSVLSDGSIFLSTRYNALKPGQGCLYGKTTWGRMQ